MCISPPSSHNEGSILLGGAAYRSNDTSRSCLFFREHPEDELRSTPSRRSSQNFTFHALSGERDGLVVRTRRCVPNYPTREMPSYIRVGTFLGLGKERWR